MNVRIIRLLLGIPIALALALVLPLLARPQGAGFDIGAVERQPGDSDLAPRVYLPLAVR